VLYAEKNNPQDLAKTIVQFIQHKNTFDKSDISARAHRLFSFNTVGKQFEDLYNTITLQ
jgi:5-carboxymethyl-2-hydroxymuconate isomerase